MQQIRETAAHWNNLGNVWESLWHACMLSITQKELADPKYPTPITALLHFFVQPCP